MTRHRHPLALLAALVFMTGCAVGPDYERPDMDTPVPDKWVRPAAGDSIAEIGTTADAVAGAGWRWWEDFGDTTLNGLVASALEHNNDLQVAVARVLEARAGVTGAKSEQWPTIEVGGSAGRTKSSEDLAFPGRLYLDSYAVTATMRYELDLWGRLSRGKEAAVANLLSSEQNRRTVAQTLIADVVRTWLEIRELQLQVALTNRTIASFESSLTTVQDRYRRGLVSALDVHLSAQNLAAALAQKPVFEGRLTAARRRMEILAGRYPAGTVTASDLELADGSLGVDVMPDPLDPVPAGLPGELVDRRPDLLAAEAALASSVARIGQAKAALYPRITLTAEGGTKSNEFENLFTSPTDAWALVGNLVMPLINRGATKAQIEAAEARAKQAVSTYRAAVLRAFAEVENAMDQEIYQERQERYLEESADRARSSVQLAQERYRRGLDNLLTTLESQRRLFNAESTLLTTQRQRRAARVDLILALGGPWEAELDTGIVTTSNQGARP